MPAGYAGLLGLAGRPYVTRINRTIHELAGVRGQDGYRDWTRALLAVL